MKKITFLICLLLSFNSLIIGCSHPKFIQKSSNHRDSTDVVHYSIHLDFSSIQDHNLNGFAELTLTPLFNATHQLAVDLLKLNVDSVFVDEAKIETFVYNDSVLRFDVNEMNVNDTHLVRIHYHGHPTQDPSGWGGFYWAPDAAFNMGVGMDDYPHVYGRTWYPCIDNFTDRASYDFFIKTSKTHAAVCGGTLMGVSNIDENTDEYHWKLHHTIPTYLASIAVGNYTAVQGIYDGLIKQIPTFVHVSPQDSMLAVGSFIKLNETMDVFETCFGPYLWERVGFVIVPFNSGAMEHATNIAYPEYAVDGSLSSETLLAHELSHHWFGNLVTCSTPEDMWLNEGWASYCEAIYKEQVYDKQAFKAYVRSNHASVLRRAANAEDGFLAVSGIPHEHTYGSTVYDKGADMVHTLRGYMGDSLFFSGIKAYLEEYKFNDASSENLRDFLSDYTQMDLNDFFDAWIFSPGFRQFSVDSFSVIPEGSDFVVTVHMRQRLRQAPNYANSNLLELTFMDNNWQQNTQTIHFDGATGNQTFTVPFEPELVLVDFDEKISDATTDYHKILYNPGNYSFSNVDFSCIVNALNDSAFVRAELHWVPADNENVADENIHLSNYFYWTINAIFPDSSETRGKFSYNFNVSEYYKKKGNDLLQRGTDTLCLLYRKNATESWVEIPHQFYGSHFSGYIMTDSLKSGDYAIGIKDVVESIFKKRKSLKTGQIMNIFPNPSENQFTIEYVIPDTGKMYIYDFNGKKVFTKTLTSEEKRLVWYPGSLPPGIYTIELVDNKNQTSSKQIVYN